MSEEYEVIVYKLVPKKDKIFGFVYREYTEQQPVYQRMKHKVNMTEISKAVELEEEPECQS